ncbi:bifunctional 5,10-methylenetetrahydrofolate dehydrogenase/5,10-methenyltetrahydrofolate cyclohydrolase [Candidatus Curtissbacteria bacterium]|nr:bifunctional 5,10-methylenetetrahydrofolate dehydrogenase/5,10-methenyltetrahydrofolate cyclohydrolase [Candidatus Curtissbacteria bacterium]
MLLLDGKVVRDKIADELKAEIEKLDQKPELVIFQLGDLAESSTYIAQKIKFGEKIGAIVTHKKLPQDVARTELIQEIQLANENESVTGIIVQLPIPNSLEKDEIIEAIDPKKDVDGQTSANIKLLFENRKEGYTPATTRGILTLLDYHKISIAGKHVVIVGRSSLVGKPTALAFLNRDATVTVCHSKTQNLQTITKSADILVAAAGKPKLITKDHVSDGQVVVDVGINVIQNVQNEVYPRQTRQNARINLEKPEAEPPARKLVGDVDFENVSKIVKAISPVPGGAGPMTVASLFQNLLEAYARQT